MTTEIAPGVTAITLRPDDNDSPQIFWIAGFGGGAVIDAGHSDEETSRRVVAAIDDLRGDGPDPELLLLTDRFDEHSGGAAYLRQRYPGLVVCAGAGDAAAIDELNGPVVGRTLTGGEEFTAADSGDSARTLHAIATPGHVAGSMCYLLQPDGILFTGDCVLSRGTTAVHLDQGGDMGAYVASLEKLAEQEARLLLSFHGAPVADAAAKLAELIRHRQEREDSILACLRDGVADVDGMRERLYGAANLEEWRWNAAREQIVAHLIKLTAEGAVIEIDAGNAYRLTGDRDK